FYVAVFPSTLAYLCYNRGVQLIGANRAAPFLHVIPVFGSVMAIFFLGERPELFHLFGYGLVLIGVFVAARKPKTTWPEGRARPRSPYRLAAFVRARSSISSIAPRWASSRCRARRSSTFPIASRACISATSNIRIMVRISSFVLARSCPLGDSRAVTSSVARA